MGLMYIICETCTCPADRVKKYRASMLIADYGDPVQENM
jgi:hypothetical protein